MLGRWYRRVGSGSVIESSSCRCRGRFFAWFAHEEEEEVARDSGSTALKSVNSRATQVGTFLSARGQQDPYYLSTSVDIACGPAARTVTTSISLTNLVVTMI